MADTAYQRTATTGLRISTELSALLHTQVPLPDLDVLNPNITPLLAYMRHFKKIDPVEGTTFVLHDSNNIIMRTALTATYASGGATQAWAVTTGTGAYIPNHSLVVNMRTGAVGQVRSRVTDTLTVVPNLDAAGDGAGLVGDQIEVLAPALEEGTDVVATVYVSPNSYTNYIQNIETAVSVTWHGMKQTGKSGYYGSPEYKRAWKINADFHERQKEKTLLLNGRAFSGAADTSAANPTPDGNTRGLTAGARGWMKQYADSDHYITSESDITEFEWLDIVEKTVAADLNSSGHKVCLCPRGLITGITKWNIGKQRFMSEDKMAGSKGSEVVPGLRFSRYETPNMALDLVRHPDLEPATAGALQRFFIFDKKSTRMTHFVGFDTAKYEDQYKTGKQVRVGFYFTALGSAFTQPNRNIWCEFNTVSV